MHTNHPHSAAHSIRSLAAIATICTAGLARAQTYDFTAVDALAQGAINGVNVDTPIPGFDLRILHLGEVVFHRSYGAWSINRVANADSATKTLSGALIMSLVDSSPSPFSLDTRISDLMPEFTGAGQFMTIRQCFSHTAGCGNSSAISNPTLTLRQAATEIASDTLDFFPGTTFSYGGVSMHAAGAAAEIAGGQPWNALFAQRITGPLNMPATRFVLTTPANPRIAGGCESNAEEFGRFMEMLRQGGVHNGTRLLTVGAVSQMFTRQTAPNVVIANTPLEGSADYGVGVWLDERTEDGRLIGALAAGARGFSSWIDFDDDLVGVLSTDLSVSQNVRQVLGLIRNEAALAARRATACNADFNNDGDTGTDADIEAFFRCIGGFCCLPCGSPDIDADGDVGTDADIEAFFRVLGGGNC
jgi:CubicO group peptidase (beta-lactamase class C family)